MAGCMYVYYGFFFSLSVIEEALIIVDLYIPIYT